VGYNEKKKKIHVPLNVYGFRGIVASKAICTSNKHSQQNHMHTKEKKKGHVCMHETVKETGQ
jgi:hypothetical protein